ncbi:sigma factor-like helix-turn-helix DNA-binding protein [Peribacillus huizhouensis]|uniref:DNA-directed RNA polymerase specialized sigma24 family protein n=1 Tax=Peribacillus huizhouensis TaxID=1501239 RepID=A0ABR6CR74_9BACI|nr:sigma factor-like helix-turn-helix DNA-binding protein [Peribacillus huizhouensis]MBA9027539.1 DNA-directed RNA polymerase specialized sigma24 family protein [Peribacillus huizhouensis]
MGAVKYDIHAGDRRLSERYALDNPEGVRLLLGDYHALLGRQYQGDYSAVDILTDLAAAIERAGLTVRQRQALRLVYEEDLTQKDAGASMGVSQQAIDIYVDNAIEKIAEIFYYWAGHGEGYAVTNTKEEA